jgi:hypothetical protein
LLRKSGRLRAGDLTCKGNPTKVSLAYIVYRQKRLAQRQRLACGGADWRLKTFRQLPGYYITEDEATKLGWIPILANLASVAPGKMLTKGVYKNRDKRLPDALGRIWYEADINYSFGYRGGERILYSNDGLIFVTYDHYATFVEIV